MSILNPLDRKDWLKLASEILSDALFQASARSVHIQGNIAGIPVDLRVHVDAAPHVDRAPDGTAP